MPFPKEDRDEAPLRLASAGELNFAVTCLINAYLRTHGKRYETMNAVVGALESAKLEFYRRVVAKYENEKQAQNGDVYNGLV